MSGRTLGSILLVLTIISSGRSRADVLHFAEGGEADVPVVIEGSVVVLDAPGESLRFPRTDFTRIEVGFDPRRDWPARRDKAMKGGASERLAAALWALDFGLVPEAVAMIGRAGAVDPEHQPTARMCDVVNRLKAVLPDPELAPILRSAPPGHRLARGPHILLIHEHSDSEAAERVAILEQVITAYYLHFSSLGIELAVPQHRFPSIWFAKKADYVSFLRGEGAEAFLTTRGYHHPTRGLVVAYDCRDDPPRKKARIDVDARRSELDRFAAQVGKLRPGSRVRVSLEGKPPQEIRAEEARDLHEKLRRQVSRQELVLALGRREIDLGVAAHETVHQLVAASHLAPRHDAFPNWLHEGLAMQFETIRAGRWAGLSSPSPLRLRDYRRLKTAPSVISTTRDVGLGRGYQEEGYARAWALVYYLRSQRPSAFVAILDGLRLPSDGKEPPGGRSSRILLDSLRVAPSDEDSRWRRFMLSVVPSPGETKVSGED
ncbi:MAG: hypothetical protein JWN86_320 [Planctomycetota bacterium]|nr:hypothetical protein [Planctomycetota bacterium]